ncbi:MAG: maltose alpha-D-glucosyltransferase [Actinomycetota bacterium]
MAQLRGAASLALARAPVLRRAGVSAVDDQELWYRDAIIYELHVRAFYDSNGDGMGDFRGLTEKLDYLKDLGVTAIWILPFYPSPWKDDGYDISDYTGVHPAYGTLRDFRTFMREAHRRGLRVITELVLNHTSDEHPWFKRARRAERGTTARDFYAWSDTPDRYKEARIIFKDFESSNWTWDAEARAYYWHRFYSHQPDLNFDSPVVRRAMLSVVDFWMDAGVDGMRLDAVPYLYEREGTSCENLPETHAFLKELRAHVDQRYPMKMFIAEANQWPEDAVAYFGDGDECQMAFHFPVMPRMFMALRMEDRFPLVDILQQTPAIPENCGWALFLRNHDELTLEMVTDEERDYMYRVYAHDPQMRLNLGIRRRLAPLLGNNRRQIELMQGLLFSLPGTPVIYYGDEIGMGDNIYLGDRNGVRTPMQWSPDRNAGFSRANPQRLYAPVVIDPEYHAEAINVEAQQNNQHSLLWWMRQLIALRKRRRALGRGSLEFLFPENRKILAFVRRHEDERILVVANLSRYVQAATLDLSAYEGMTPVEMFGATELPRITSDPYFMTLGPHTFYWFDLQPQVVETIELEDRSPEISLRAQPATLDRSLLATAEPLLPSYLRSRRWFSGKDRRIKAATFSDVVPVSEQAAITIVSVVFVDGEPQSYSLPLMLATGADAERIASEQPRALLARLRWHDGHGTLSDAFFDNGFAETLLGLIARRRRLRGAHGAIGAHPSRRFRSLVDGNDLTPNILHAEQSNTSVAFGNAVILKLFRRVEEGDNPDLVVGRYLTEHRSFSHVAPLAGWVEYQSNGHTVTLGILQGYVPNEGDAWSYALDQARAYLHEVLARPEAAEQPPAADGVHLLQAAETEAPEIVHALLGPFLDMTRLLGQRTAELHVALSSGRDDRLFEREPLTPFAQRALYQSMRALTRGVFTSIRRDPNPEISSLAAYEDRAIRSFAALIGRPLGSVLIRTHGDLHLGQVLHTGKDFVIIDFEGEPWRPLGTRLLKRSPLSDVAGMVRSFHYAIWAALLQSNDQLLVDNKAGLEPWAELWFRWIAASFLRAYLDAARPAGLLPVDDESVRTLLDVFLLEKAVYELGYEAANRPSWLPIAARGVRSMLGR